MAIGLDQRELEEQFKARHIRQSEWGGIVLQFQVGGLDATEYGFSLFSTKLLQILLYDGSSEHSSLIYQESRE